MREDWIEVEIGEIGEIITGNTPSKKNPNFYVTKEHPFYKPTDLEAGANVNHSNDGLSQEGYENARIAVKGSVLVTCIGATIGKTGLIQKNGAFNQQINGITPFYGIDSKFIYYQVIGLNFQKKIKENASSTTLPILNKGKFSLLELNLAPLPEQRLIVSKIEQLFSELDNGIANLKKAQEQLKVYRQAVLKKAFEGNYQEVKVFEISDVKTGSTPKRGNVNYWKNGSIPWVTSGALNNVFVNEANEFITETALKETNCKVIPKGSLLVAMYGEGKTRGKCSELNIDAATNQAIATITISEEHEESKQFIKWFFIKNYEEIRLLSSGGVQPNLNLSIIKNTVIPFPSKEEQHQIIQEIETRLSVCDKVEESITQSLEKAEALRQSILKKAFEGKLLNKQELEECRKEKDWEPAEKSLERIKTK